MNKDSYQPLIFEDKSKNYQEWRPVSTVAHPDIKPIYWVSSGGVVYSESHNIILAPEFSNCGYLRVHLFNKDNTQKHYSIHRLVLESFVPIDNFDQYDVNHIDGHKCNNALWNLEWVSKAYNKYHAIRNSLQTWREGDECSWANINAETADRIGQAIQSQMYTFNKIALDNNCSKAIVHNIAFGISWKFVYIKYKLWRYKRVKKRLFNPEEQIIIYKYIDDYIKDYSFDEYRFFCMDLYMDLFQKIINRDIYVELMDYVYMYLDERNMI